MDITWRELKDRAADYLEGQLIVGLTTHNRVELCRWRKEAGFRSGFYQENPTGCSVVLRLKAYWPIPYVEEKPREPRFNKKTKKM